jgi:hypothetical protein
MTIPTFMKGINETHVQLHRLKHSSDLKFRYGGWYQASLVGYVQLICFVGWNFGLSKLFSQYLLALWVWNSVLDGQFETSKTLNENNIKEGDNLYSCPWAN